MAKKIQKSETLTLPDLGRVEVKSLRLTKYLEIAAARREGDMSEMTDTEFLIYLMPHTIFDSEGNPALSDPDEWDQYLGVNMKSSAQVFEAVRNVTGLTEGAEDAEKK